MKNLILFLLVLQSVILQAQQIPDYNKNQKFVSDFADILTTAEEQSLQSTLNNYEKKTGTEIAVVTQNDLQGYDIEGYSNKLFRTWGIGKEGINNGLLILISPNNRQSRIETGYGLEANLTDFKCRELTGKYFKTNFKEKKYYEGINGIINEFITILGNKTPYEKEQEKIALEKQLKAEAEKAAEEFSTFLSWVGIFILFIAIIIGVYLYWSYRQRIQEEKEEEERQRLLKIQREKQAEERRIQKRADNIKSYQLQTDKLNQKLEQLKQLYNSCEKELLDNKEIYSTATIQKHKTFDEIKNASDLDIELSLRNVIQSIKEIENAIKKIEENSTVRNKLINQFNNLNQDLENLVINVSKHFKSSTEFNKKYPGLFKNFKKDLRSNLVTIEENIEKGISLINKNPILSTGTYLQINKLISEINHLVNDINGVFKEFTDLNIEVSNAEHTVSTITINKLDLLYEMANEAISQKHVSQGTINRFNAAKNTLGLYKKNGGDDNILSLAIFLIGLEKLLKSIPELAQNDIDEYHAEIERKRKEAERRKFEEEEEEKRRKRRKQQEEEEEERRKNNSISSISTFSSFNSSSDSESSFGGGDSGGGGTTDSW